MKETQLSELLHQLSAQAPAVDWAGTAVELGRRRQRTRRALYGAASAFAVAGVVIVSSTLGAERSTLKSANGQDQVAASTSLQKKALAQLRQIDGGDCGPTAASFDAVVKAHLDAAQLCASYREYTGEFGSLVRPTKVDQASRGELTVVRVMLKLKRADGEYRVTFNSAGRIAGIYFLRSGVPLPP